MKPLIYLVLCAVGSVLWAACDGPSKHKNAASNEEMVALLAKISKNNFFFRNDFSPAAKVAYYRSSLAHAITIRDSANLELLITNALLENGDEEEAVAMGETIIRQTKHIEPDPPLILLKTLAIAYMRLGERVNCVKNHTVDACIFPIKGTGVQKFTTGSEKAIDLYKEILRRDPTDSESRWLINIAYMVLGRYPSDVPDRWLIPNLGIDSVALVKPFTDLGMAAGINAEDMSGGSIVEDFDNDGNLDIVTSSWGLTEPMHYRRNMGDGTFKDVSIASGLQQFTGGLNMMQTDYNNDGFKDIFVTRGGWMKEFGLQPNSLLRNNGDGTFTDVTKESGMLSFHPTQTATWSDFNGDGFLDVYIGNESMEKRPPHPCELYMNNGDGTFTEMAKAAGLDFVLYVKGVTTGDIDNDGRPDIFISTLDGKKLLLKNETPKNGKVVFKDISESAGLTNKVKTFTTWFFDYDNDGLMDIMVGGYNFDKSLAWYAGLEAMNAQRDKSGDIFIYHNEGNGKFKEMSDEIGVNKIVFPMGANFGDINNDGYPDMFFGTGNPLYQSLVPNKMFLNMGGRRFADVTASARVGNLQKGHGVSFADLDYDGDEDIHIEMGGAFPGDAYQNSLFINPGQNDNHWINVSLEGVKANRAAIGAKVKVTFNEGDSVRSVYRELNSGGSFGSNPLMQHIGVGGASEVSSIEIKWPGSGTVQVFKSLAVDKHFSFKEDSEEVKVVDHKRVSFGAHGGHDGASAVGHSH